VVEVLRAFYGAERALADVGVVFDFDLVIGDLTGDDGVPARRGLLFA